VPVDIVDIIECCDEECYDFANVFEVFKSNDMTFEEYVYVHTHTHTHHSTPSFLSLGGLEGRRE